MGKMKTGDIHLHARDIYDSTNDIQGIVDRLKELGAKGFYLTQHGVMSASDDMLQAAQKAGLKKGTGIEIYFKDHPEEKERQHLLLLSMNDIGTKAINIAVSESQEKDGMAVLNWDSLNHYFGPNTIGHGNVVATTACVQGVVASALRLNDLADARIAKLRHRQEKLGLTDEDQSFSEELQNLQERIGKKTLERNNAKKKADVNFSRREAYVESLKDGIQEVYLQEKEALDRDKAYVDEVRTEYEKLKKEVASLLKEKTDLAKKEKGLKEKLEKNNVIENMIQKIYEQKSTQSRMVEIAEDRLLRLNQIFGQGNLYAEVQYHGIPMEKDIYPIIATLARQHGIPIVASNDVHMVNKSEECILNRAIQKARRFESWTDNQIGDDQLYIKTDAEMEEMLLKILPADVVREAMDNIEVLIDRNVETHEIEKHYPKFSADDTHKEFHRLLNEGITWRFPDGMDQEHKLRLEKEVAVIEGMGYTDYHLVVADFLRYARTKGTFTVGPGRGSAVGSLVCYLLGITALDPIKYDLLFERFLNPERVSMPDIDVDLANRVRYQVIDYVTNKYGQDSVCSIMTITSQGPKGALRTAAKYLGVKEKNDPKIYLSIGDALAKDVPDDIGTKFDSMTSNGQTVYRNMLDKTGGDSVRKKIVKWAKAFEGSCTAYGAHAAGVVISDGTPIKEITPLRWNDALQVYTTQCNKEQVEEKGLLKFDFLGLQTLDIISDVLDMVKGNTGRVIDPLKIPLTDSDVYKEIYTKGNTNSVFQFESSGMKQMLKQFQPETFEDLIILVAMYRPGPLQYLDDVIQVKHGNKPLTYLTPELEPILGKTYGATVYQEQVMQIFQKLAGYSLGGADMVRRYMSKKKADKLAEERKAFVHGDPSRGIHGCVANGISEEIGNEIFNQMAAFAKYCFNKSHAAAYAYLSYITAWLKHYYPVEFLCAAMNRAKDMSGKTDKLPGLMCEAKAMGVTVLAPDINNSQANFIVVDHNILFGLGSIKSVGAAGEAIINERNENGRFASLKDFFERTKVGHDVIENLVLAGAFDAYNDNRQAILSVLSEYQKYTKKYLEKKCFIDQATAFLPFADDCRTQELVDQMLKENQIDLKTKPTTAEKLKKRIENARKSMKEFEDALNCIVIPMAIREDKSLRLAKEKELLGAYVTAHPLDDYPSPEDLNVTAIEGITKSTRRIFGIVQNIQVKYRKSDHKPMAFLTLEDHTGSISLNVFTAQYSACERYLKDGAAVIVTGTVSERETLIKDDAGNPVMETSFNVKSMCFACKEKSTYIMEVSSYAAFHLDQEDDFRKTYEEGNGHKLLIHDYAMDEIREMTYTVSDQTILLSNITEI